MNLFFSIALFFVSLVGLLFFSDRAVNYLQKVAKGFGVSPLFIGLTVAAIGTSFPEIFTNITVAFSSDHGGLAIGNIVGSCLSQITIILGVVALFGVLKMKRKKVLVDGSMMLLATFILGYVLWTGSRVTALESAGMILLYCGYIYYIYRQEKNGTKHVRKTHFGLKTWTSLGLSLLCLVAVVFSANGVVSQSLIFAKWLGFSPFAIGLLLGLGTSLPELMVAVMALRKGDVGLSMGDLFGSNITDPLFSLSIGSVFKAGGFVIPFHSIVFDLIWWFVASLIVYLVFLIRGRLSWKLGIVLILSYVIYLVLRLGF